MNKNYKIQIETLTPLHIGSGEKAIFGLDYYLEGTTVTFIDFPRLIDEIKDEKEREELFRAMDSRDIGNIKSMMKKYGKERYAIENKADRHDLVKKGVDTILKTSGDVVYIPGSSVKGAIRTSLIYNRIGEEEKREIRERIKFGKINEIEAIMESVLKRETYGIKVDILKSLIIRDSDVKKVDECASVSLLNTSIDRGAHVYEQLIEIINPGVEFEGKISVKNETVSIEEVKDAANTFALRTIEHEEKFFGNYLTWWWRRRRITTESILECYEDLKEKSDNLGGNDFLLNLGRHSGHHAKTGWSTFRDYELLFDGKTSREIANLVKKIKKVKTPFPKTRSAVLEGGSLKPFGWVKVRVYEN